MKGIVVAPFLDNLIAQTGCAGQEDEKNGYWKIQSGELYGLAGWFGVAKRRLRLFMRFRAW